MKKNQKNKLKLSQLKLESFSVASENHKFLFTGNGTAIGYSEASWCRSLPPTIIGIKCQLLSVGCGK